VLSNEILCCNCKSSAEAARIKLKSNEDSNKLSDELEKEFPFCLCEAFSVGEGSPGRVLNAEVLYRIMISPRDYDGLTGQIAEQPFRKVFKNGLSVCRSIATDDDVKALVEDGLHHREVRCVRVIAEADVGQVRQLSAVQDRQVFCVYDHTVTRLDTSLAPVPSHASVFLREPAPKTSKRETLQKDLTGKLKDLFLARVVNVADWRNGALEDLNKRASEGEFLAEKPD